MEIKAMGCYVAFLKKRKKGFLFLSLHWLNPKPKQDMYNI
jgi:hypothetical protein